MSLWCIKFSRLKKSLGLSGILGGRRTREPGRKFTGIDEINEIGNQEIWERHALNFSLTGVEQHLSQLSGPAPFFHARASASLHCCPVLFVLSLPGATIGTGFPWISLPGQTGQRLGSAQKIAGWIWQASSSCSCPLPGASEYPHCIPSEACPIDRKDQAYYHQLHSASRPSQVRNYHQQPDRQHSMAHYDAIAASACSDRASRT